MFFWIWRPCPIGSMKSQLNIKIPSKSAPTSPRIGLKMQVKSTRYISRLWIFLCGTHLKPFVNSYEGEKCECVFSLQQYHNCVLIWETKFWGTALILYQQQCLFKTCSTQRSILGFLWREESIVKLDFSWYFFFQPRGNTYTRVFFISNWFFGQPQVA